MSTMFLNVSLAAPTHGGMDASNASCTILKTPEIVSSLISLTTSPPALSVYDYNKRSTADYRTAQYLSPADTSTPSDDYTAMGGPWGRGANSPRPPHIHIQEPQPPPFYNQPSYHPPEYSSLLTPSSDGSSPPPQSAAGNYHHQPPVYSSPSYTGSIPELTSPQYPPVSGAIEMSSPLYPSNSGVTEISSPLFPPNSGIPELSSPLYPPQSAEVPELSSPVSTLEATRSVLIKEGLKLTIKNKLQQQLQTTSSGDCTSSDLLCPDTGVVVKTELTHEDEERRRRRRERNKVAATKCRNKKKEMTEILVSEHESVEDMNARLKGEVERLTTEKDRLELCLSDKLHRTNCKRSTTSHHATSPTSPSSYCSSSCSPCSLTSLVSPCDSKDFIDTLHLPPACSTSSSSAVVVSSANNDVLPSSCANSVVPSNNDIMSSLASSLDDCNSSSSSSFSNIISVASTAAAALDQIEPSIPIEAVSTSCSSINNNKAIVSRKYKAAPPNLTYCGSSSRGVRYHPYMYTPPPSGEVTGSAPHFYTAGHHQNIMKQETILSPSSNSRLSSNSTTSSTIGYSMAATTVLTTIDTKINPFRYPVVSTTDVQTSYDSREPPQLTPLDVMSSCDSHDPSTEPCGTPQDHKLSRTRYTPYSRAASGYHITSAADSLSQQSVQSSALFSPNSCRSHL